MVTAARLAGPRPDDAGDGNAANASLPGGPDGGGTVHPVQRGIGWSSWPLSCRPQLDRSPHEGKEQDYSWKVMRETRRHAAGRLFAASHDGPLREEVSRPVRQSLPGLT